MNRAKIFLLSGIVVWLTGLVAGVAMTCTVTGAPSWAVFEALVIPALGIGLLVAAGFTGGAIFTGTILTLVSLLPIALDTPMTLAFGATLAAFSGSILTIAGGVLSGIGIKRMA